MVAEQLQNVRAEIRKACEKSGRNPEEVTLIAVSKTKPISMIREAMDAGQTIFGENKVQELCTKYEELPKNLEWHLIGHLQRNKSKIYCRQSSTDSFCGFSASGRNNQP